MKRIHIISALILLLAVSLSLVFLYYRFLSHIVRLDSFEEIDRDPQPYDGATVTLSGYLIKSENPLIQYYLAPDLSIINDPQSTKMVLLAGDIETLVAKFDLESHLSFVADFPRNNITQIRNQKVILTGQVNCLEAWIRLPPYAPYNSSKCGWCLIPERIHVCAC